MFAVHQPGIATPLLDHVAFTALNVFAGSRAEWRGLLAELTVEAERLMRAEHRLRLTGGLQAVSR